jgi:hypothetical protein
MKYREHCYDVSPDNKVHARSPPFFGEAAQDVTRRARATWISLIGCSALLYKSYVTLRDRDVTRPSGDSIPEVLYVADLLGLMEDLATGRMSTAQIAQRVLHRVPEDGGEVHDFALVKRLLQEETDDIIKLGSLSGQAAARYRKAAKIAAHWIRNYTAFDFRSLGSYMRADLERIASGPEAF